MADITLTAGDYIRPHKSPWGAFPTRTVKCSTGTSTQVIRLGQTVVLDLSGSTAFRDCVIPCGVSSGTLNPAAASIVGIAAETPPTTGLSTVVGGTPVIAVWDCNPNVEFRSRTRYGVITSSCVGQTYELGRDSTLNIEYVMLNASSLTTPAKTVVVTGLLDNPGDSGGALTWRFIQSSGYLAYYK